MSRTWKREPTTYREHDENNIRYRRLRKAVKGETECLIGTISSGTTDAMMSGDNTFVRSAGHG